MGSRAINGSSCLSHGLAGYSTRWMRRSMQSSSTRHYMIYSRPQARASLLSKSAGTVGSSSPSFSSAGPSAGFASAWSRTILVVRRPSSSQSSSMQSSPGSQHSHTTGGIWLSIASSLPWESEGNGQPARHSSLKPGRKGNERKPQAFSSQPGRSGSSSLRRSIYF